MVNRNLRTVFVFIFFALIFEFCRYFFLNTILFDLYSNSLGYWILIFFQFALGLLAIEIFTKNWRIKKLSLLDRSSFTTPLLYCFVLLSAFSFDKVGIGSFSDNSVKLSEKYIQVTSPDLLTNKKIPLRSNIKEINSQPDLTNIGIKVKRVAENVEIVSKELSQDINNFQVKVKIVNQMFNVEKDLDTGSHKSVSMGPLTISLIDQELTENPTSSPSIKIINMSTGKQKDIPLKRTFEKTQKFENISVTFVRKYEQAVVVDNKIAEGGEIGKNPALEYIIKKDNEELREILFINFKDFSLHPSGVFGYKLEYSGQPPTPETNGNLITVLPTADSFKVTLYKLGKIIDTKSLNLNEPFQTPWMGIQFTILSKKNLTQTQMEITGEKPLSFESLPIPAVEISEANASFWLIEGQPLSTHSGNIVGLFRNTLPLPFSLNEDALGYKQGYLVAKKSNTFFVSEAPFYLFQIFILSVLLVLILMKSLVMNPK